MMNEFKRTGLDILVDLSDWHLCLVVQCTRMGTEQGEQFLPGMKNPILTEWDFALRFHFIFQQNHCINLLVRRLHKVGCFVYRKGTIFQANHNQFLDANDFSK
ncbi:hypothetical protein, partial [Prevotella fusca]|uniref:hypothetical protein n=1 Tax=Prevotella fusca TaxID=589436 RepID=UPI001F236F02